MILNSLNDLIAIAKSKRRKRIAVVAANDGSVLKAVINAYTEGLAEPVLIGDVEKIKKNSDEQEFDLSGFEWISEKDPEKCAEIAVKLAKQGETDILMKGNLPSAIFLKAVVDNKNGLKKKDLLSHFALIQTSFYHKLLGITDAAMNINPNLSQKISILENALDVLHKIGMDIPKVAVLAPLETVNEKIVSSLDASELKLLQHQNHIKGCIIEGPLALDNAVSKNAARQKGIVSDVAGDADILLVPDLNSGNILYKSLIFLSDGISAGIITGASVPIVLTSRADSHHSKLCSIALAAILD